MAFLPAGLAGEVVNFAGITLICGDCARGTEPRPPVLHRVYVEGEGAREYTLFLPETGSHIDCLFPPKVFARDWPDVFLSRGTSRALLRPPPLLNFAFIPAEIFNTYPTIEGIATKS